MLALVAALALAAPEAAVVQPAFTAPPPASLLGGAALDAGGIAFSAEAGFPFVRLDWAQGLGGGVDLGASASIDWLLGEWVAGATTRYELARSGGFALGARGRVGVWGDLGPQWAAPTNRSDLGVALEPGVAMGLAAGGGTLSLSLDLPFALTLQQGSGAVLHPRATLAWETPLTSDLAVGAQLMGGARYAFGAAPLADLPNPRAEVALLGVCTWRLF